MPKRTPIKGLGSDAWFTPSPVLPGGQSPSKSVARQTGKSASQPAVKATFYLTKDQVMSLEELRLGVLKKTGERVDKSELVREAIGLLVKHYAGKAARQ